MSGRNQAELQVVFDIHGEMYRVCTVKFSRKGDLYFMNHHPLIGGKTSEHPGGTVTHEVDLLGLRSHSKNSRENSTGATQLSWGGVWHLRAYGGGGSGLGDPGRPVSSLKRESKRRKLLVVRWTRTPNRVWGVELWGFDPDADSDALADAARTAPYKDCEVVGHVAADWVTPGFLVTIWRAEVAIPYQPIKATNAVTGETFIRVPPRFDETRFAEEHDEADLWLPRPLSPEKYGPEPWDTHPALHPERFAGI